MTEKTCKACGSEIEANSSEKQPIANGSLVTILIRGGSGIAEVTLPSGEQFFTKRHQRTRVPVEFGDLLGISPVALN